jgi:hypothetical protein
MTNYFANYKPEKTNEIVFFKKNENNILEPFYGDFFANDEEENTTIQNRNEYFPMMFQQIKPTITAKIYVGSLVVVGLFVVFRALIKK